MKALLRLVVLFVFMLLCTESFAQDNSKPAFRVAPNPADDYIELFYEADHSTLNALRIFDLIGNQVSALNLTNNTSHPVRIETAALKPGVYFLSVYSNSGRIETLKFLKVR